MRGEPVLWAEGGVSFYTDCFKLRGVGFRVYPREDIVDPYEWCTYHDSIDDEQKECVTFCICDQGTLSYRHAQHLGAVVYGYCCSRDDESEKDNVEHLLCHYSALEGDWPKWNPTFLMNFMISLALNKSAFWTYFEFQVVSTVGVLFKRGSC